MIGANFRRQWGFSCREGEAAKKRQSLLVRYDKLAERYLATVKLASGLLWFRRWYELNPTLTF